MQKSFIQSHALFTVALKCTMNRELTKLCSDAIDVILSYHSNAAILFQVTTMLYLLLASQFVMCHLFLSLQ